MGASATSDHDDTDMVLDKAGALAVWHGAGGEMEHGQMPTQSR